MSGNFFRKLGLKELQDKHQLPVLVKIKSRSGESPLANIETIKRNMPSDVEFEVVVDVLDDNLMVAESKVVLDCAKYSNVKTNSNENTYGGN